MTIECQVQNLREGDVYTSDGGESWRTVQSNLGPYMGGQLDTSDDVVLLQLDIGDRVWHWSDETVIVK